MPLVLDGTNGVSGVDGTASNPAIEGTDTNTGIFFPAADTVAIGTGGTERLRVDSAGNAGLAVTPSAWKSNYKAVQVGNAAQLVGRTDANWLYAGSNWFVNSSNQDIYQNNGNATIYIQNAGSHLWYTAPSGTAGNAITFTQAMTLDASGNLYLGATSGARGSTNTRQLVKMGTSAAYFEVQALDTSSSVGMLFSDGSGGNYGLIDYLSTDNMVFYTASTERARIDSSGNVGIGTSSPNAKLDILATTNTIRLGRSTSSYATIDSNSNAGSLNFNADAGNIAGGGSMTFNFAGTERARITSAGEFLVAGTTDQGAYNIQCNGTGVWGAGAYVNGSDARIKENIAPIASGLDVVTKLNPVTYRYKEDWSKDQSTQTGFIAQELLVAMEGQNYVDGVVQQGGSEGYYSVAYQNIIPLLTKAIQEQQAMIDELKAKVAALENA